MYGNRCRHNKLKKKKTDSLKYYILIKEVLYTFQKIIKVIFFTAHLTIREPIESVSDYFFLFYKNKCVITSFHSFLKYLHSR